MNKSVVKKITASIACISLAATLSVGVATSAQATVAGNKKPNSISSEYSKKNGWKVFYGNRNGAWVAENTAWGGLAIPKRRSSKKVSLNITSVDSGSRETTQDYKFSFSGFNARNGVRVEVVEAKKLIPVQVFNNVRSGDVLSIKVDTESGDVCSGFYVIVKDAGKNWAIQEISALYIPN